MEEHELAGTLDITIDKVNDSLLISLDSRDIERISKAIESGFSELAKAIKEAASTVWLENQ